MIVYIFNDDERVDEFTLPENCSFETFIDSGRWNNFGLWLFTKGYLRPPYRLEFKSEIREVIDAAWAAQRKYDSRMDVQLQLDDP